GLRNAVDLQQSLIDQIAAVARIPGEKQHLLRGEMADPRVAKQRGDERGRQDRKQRIGRRGVFRHCGRRCQGEKVRVTANRISVLPLNRKRSPTKVVSNSVAKVCCAPTLKPAANVSL